ncbi:hypothetical protein CANMA_002700 [Candida margitis]|uniref:uncharacterized protein n=1 Tax=Candida margitis TaxID=1775924 RepID=UPI0022266A84|nr:uncharacterized protein CANMA_002700 [Candida margitis]KAI5967932.1 hypothetical protein CANMA_002700 [Candida margitis]
MKGNSKSRSSTSANTKSLDANQLRSRHLYNLIHSTSTPSTSPLNKLYSLQFDKVNNINGITPPPLVDHKICHECGLLLIPGLNVSIRIKYTNNNKRNKNKIRINEGADGSGGDASDVAFKGKGHAGNSRRLRYKCLSCGYKTYEPLLDGSEKQRRNTTTATINGTNNATTNDAVEAPEPSSGEVTIMHSNQSLKSKLDPESTPETEIKPTISTATTTIETEKTETNQSNSKNKSAKQRAKKRKAELNLLSNLKQRKTDQSSKLDSLNLMDFLQ